MVESIKELRSLVRKTESTYSNKLAVQPFPYIKFMRFFSVYFVWLGIILKMTPNQMTFVSMCTAIMAGIFFSFGSPVYLIIGAFLLIIFGILDCADGELARYLKQKSPIGRYFDLWVHGIESSSMFTGMAFGVYRITNNIFALFLGFVTVIGSLLIAYSGALKHYHVNEYVLNTGDKEIFKKAKPRPKGFILSGYDLKQIFSSFTIPYIILVVALFDMLVKPTTIVIFGKALLITGSFIYMLLFAIIVPILTLKTVRNTLILQKKLKMTKINA